MHSCNVAMEFLRGSFLSQSLSLLHSAVTSSSSAWHHGLGLTLKSLTLSCHALQFARLYKLFKTDCVRMPSLLLFVGKLGWISGAISILWAAIPWRLEVFAYIQSSAFCLVFEGSSLITYGLYHIYPLIVFLVINWISFSEHFAKPDTL